MSMRVDASTSYLPPEPTLPVPTRTRSEAQENAPAGLAERPLVIQTPFLDQALSCLPQLQSQTTDAQRQASCWDFVEKTVAAKPFQAGIAKRYRHVWDGYRKTLRALRVDLFPVNNLKIALYLASVMPSPVCDRVQSIIKASGQDVPDDSTLSLRIAKEWYIDMLKEVELSTHMQWPVLDGERNRIEHGLLVQEVNAASWIGAELDTPLAKPSSPSARPRASYNEQGGSADEEDKSRSNEKSVTPRPSATRAEDRSVRSLAYANLPSPTLKPSKVVLAKTTTVVADTTLSPLLDAFLEDLPAKLVALRQEVYRSTNPGRQAQCAVGVEKWVELLPHSSKSPTRDTVKRWNEIFSSLAISPYPVTADRLVIFCLGCSAGPLRNRLLLVAPTLKPRMGTLRSSSVETHVRRARKLQEITDPHFPQADMSWALHEKRWMYLRRDILHAYAVIDSANPENVGHDAALVQGQAVPVHRAVQTTKNAPQPKQQMVPLKPQPVGVPPKLAPKLPTPAFTDFTTHLPAIIAMLRAQNDFSPQALARQERCKALVSAWINAGSGRTQTAHRGSAVRWYEIFDSLRISYYPVTTERMIIFAISCSAGPLEARLRAMEPTLAVRTMILRASSVDSHLKQARRLQAVTDVEFPGNNSSDLEVTKRWRELRREVLYEYEYIYNASGMAAQSTASDQDTSPAGTPTGTPKPSTVQTNGAAGQPTNVPTRVGYDPKRGFIAAKRPRADKSEGVARLAPALRLDGDPSWHHAPFQEAPRLTLAELYSQNPACTAPVGVEQVQHDDPIAHDDSGYVDFELRRQMRGASEPAFVPVVVPYERARSLGANDIRV